MPVSRYKVGDLVEVRSEEEILNTLDDRGMLEGMPFMPEMLRFCGRQFQVSKVAHKTCDTMHYSGIRRLPKAVHLADLRCDGSEHGGCQAACLLVWKDDWLKPAGSHDASSRARRPAAAEGRAHGQYQPQGTDRNQAFRIHRASLHLPGHGIAASHHCLGSGGTPLNTLLMCAREISHSGMWSEHCFWPRCVGVRSSFPIIPTFRRVHDWTLGRVRGPLTSCGVICTVTLRRASERPRARTRYERAIGCA